MLTPCNGTVLAPDIGERDHICGEGSGRHVIATSEISGAGDRGAGVITDGTGTSGSSGGEGVRVTSGTRKATEVTVATASLEESDEETKDASVDSSTSKELCTFTANISSDLLSFVRMDTNLAHNLTMLDGSSETDVACGDVHMSVRNEITGKYEPRILERAYYTPNARCNLISLGYMLIDAGYDMSFSKDKRKLWLIKTGMKLEFRLVDGLYRMWTHKATESTVKADQHMVLDVEKSSAIGKSAAMRLLHNRLNHAGMEDIRRHAQQFEVGFNVNSKQLESYDCVPCRMGKFKHGKFLLIVAEATRFKWVYLLTHKGEAEGHLLFKVNKALEGYCTERGIETTTTNGRSSQENSIVERANCILVPRVRAMLAATRLPKELWTTSALAQGETPYEKLYGKKPDLGILRTWGYLVQDRIAPESRRDRDKLDSRTDMCILLGYSHNTIGVKLLSLQNGGDNGDTAIPIVAIKSGIESYAEDDEVARRLIALLLWKAKMTT
ncbi:hypothetical protein PHMEG_00012076 [Phytophthora megakarya]|uniref:Integrase catalytic domain-containing protein n=1 Tax=Phytophthora megakarya TaxID=4795 RepID=A0A225WA65_9STRA|nr:hypothetical protein PHMEG_00012076 [Phytophthora megakarya]